VIELAYVVVFPVGLEKVAVDIEVSNGAGATADVAQHSAKGFRFASNLDVGREIEKFECGFETASGGTQPVNRFHRRIVHTIDDCRLEREGLAEKGSNGLRHGVASSKAIIVWIFRILVGKGHCQAVKVARNRGNEWVFSDR
jgi:hypothetical protein